MLGTQNFWSIEIYLNYFVMKNLLLESWYLQLEQDLNTIQISNLPPCKRLSDSLQIIREKLAQVADHLKKYPFKDQEEEIYFFKKLSPKFYSSWIFVISYYQLELNTPLGSLENCKSYYDDELNVINRYFNQNAFYYHYFRSEARELDAVCFVRESQMDSIPVSEILLSENDLSTSFDLLFAKFIAYEKLQILIVAKINGEDKIAKPATIEELPITTTRINLSVDQIGLIARAADDARLLNGRSFNKICEELAPYISTMEREKISSNSLRSNAYLSEFSDKQNVIKTLEKMIDFIKGY
jgi:hypothetical protein